MVIMGIGSVECNLVFGEVVEIGVWEGGTCRRDHMNRGTAGHGGCVQVGEDTLSFL